MCESVVSETKRGGGGAGKYEVRRAWKPAACCGHRSVLNFGTEDRKTSEIGISLGAVEGGGKGKRGHFPSPAASLRGHASGAAPAPSPLGRAGGRQRGDPGGGLRAGGGNGAGDGGAGRRARESALALARPRPGGATWPRRSRAPAGRWRAPAAATARTAPGARRPPGAARPGPEWPSSARALRGRRLARGCRCRRARKSRSRPPPHTRSRSAGREPRGGGRVPVGRGVPSLGGCPRRCEPNSAARDAAAGMRWTVWPGSL